MGLLNSVLGALTGGHSNSGQGDGLRAVIAILADEGSGWQPGGLDGLVCRLQLGGLGEIVSSWVSTGHNLPVSPEQLHEALGGDWVTRFAHELEMQPGDALRSLSRLLPAVVDQLTPDGYLPDVGTSGFGDLDSVLGRLLHH